MNAFDLVDLFKACIPMKKVKHRPFCRLKDLTRTPVWWKCDKWQKKKVLKHSAPTILENHAI